MDTSSCSLLSLNGQDMERSSIRFDILGMEYLTLVECKRYRNQVKREKVQILFDKIRAVAAHKGILVSTSGFQNGAVEYARQHGIALIQIVDGVVLKITNSADRNNVGKYINIPNYVGLFIFEYDFPIEFVSEKGNDAIERYLKGR